MLPAVCLCGFLQAFCKFSVIGYYFKLAALHSRLQVVFLGSWSGDLQPDSWSTHWLFIVKMSLGKTIKQYCALLYMFLCGHREQTNAGVCLCFQSTQQKSHESK